MGRDEACSVFLGNLSDHARNDDIEKFFKGFGKLKDVSLKGGYGFVQFEDKYDAKDAVRELDGKDLCGQRVRIELSNGARDRRRGRSRSRSRSRDRRQRKDSRDSPRRRSYYDKTAYRKYGAPTRTKWTIEIDNLSEKVSWQDLKDFFRRVGEVTYGEAHDKTRCGPGRGVICFEKRRDMDRAVKEYDNYDLKGRKMEMKIVIGDQDEGSGSRSRSRSPPRRSRSRSRSKSRSRSRRSRSYSRRSRSR